MRYSPQQKAETKARLLRCAARLSKRAGMAAASIDHIASDAGVTGAAIYHHFSSKQALFAAVVSQECQASFLTRLSKTPQLTPAQLQEGITQYLSPEHVLNVEGGCPLPALGADISRADDSVKRDVESWIIEVKQAWESTLGSSPQAWGVFAQTLGTLMVARMLSQESLQQQVLDESLLDMRARLKGHVELGVVWSVPKLVDR